MQWRLHPAYRTEGWLSLRGIRALIATSDLLGFSYRKAEDAPLTLASEWKQKLDQVTLSAPGQDRTPPVMIVVCDNTDIAEHFYRSISGEELIQADMPDDEATPAACQPRAPSSRTARREVDADCIRSESSTHSL